MLQVFIYTFLLFFLVYSSAYSLTISANEMNCLQNGDVLKNRVMENSVKGTECRVLINAPQEKVWQVLENKQNLPKIIDRIKEIEMLSENPDSQTVKTSIKICSLLPKFHYTLLFDNSEKYRKMSFIKTAGCFKALFGTMEFIPCGDSTILNCKIYADPGFTIPEFIRSKLGGDVDEIMLSIKEEAER